jgi:hypothetical protein
LWYEPQAWFSFGSIQIESDAYGKVTGFKFDVPNDDFFFEELLPIKLKKVRDLNSTRIKKKTSFKAGFFK